MDTGKKIFKGKTLEDLFSEIYTNSKKNKDTITTLILQLQPMVTEDDEHSAKKIVPLIKDYLEILVKNDEQLIKLATVIQRLDKNGSGDGMDDILKDLGLEELVKDSQNVEKNVQATKKKNL